MKCDKCHGELKIMKWNSAVNIAICDNYNCSKYREPITTRAEPTLPEEVKPEKKLEPDKKIHRNSRKDRLNGAK